MPKSRSLFLALAVFAGALVVWHPAVSAPADSAEAPASPNRAPAWQLKDVDGKVISSEQFKGKVVVFDFWATWCPPCRAELPGYVQLQKKYGADGLVIIGAAVSEPDAATVKKFATENGIQYQLVMADDAVQKAFGGIQAVPTTFLIDRGGVIRDMKVGSVETSEYEKRILRVLQED